MQRVAAEIGGPGVRAGQPSPGQLPSSRGRASTSQTPVEPSKLSGRSFQGSWVRDGRLASREYGQVTDADIHSNRGRLPVGGRDLTFNLGGEGHEPAVGRSGDGGGQNPGGALLQAAGELASRLVGLEDADTGKLDMLAVRQHLDRAGGEAAGVPTAALLLELWEADRAALAVTAPGVAPVPQSSGQSIQAGGVGLLGVLGPPWGDFVLRPVPFPPQLRQRPWHLHPRVGSMLVEVGLDQRQTPVVGDPGGSAMRREGTTLGRSRVEREPVGLGHGGHDLACSMLAVRSIQPTIGTGPDNQRGSSTARPRGHADSKRRRPER